MSSSVELVVPRGTPGMEPLRLDTTNIQRAESRIHEVAIVSATKAPELLAFFNMAYLDGTRIVAMLELELNNARRYCNGVRSVVMLDRAPTILKGKGLATDKNPGGSADLRQAVLDGDVEYQQALEREQQIEALLEMVKGKIKSFEMAYTSVKKILGESGHERRPNPYLSGDTGGEDAGSAPDSPWGTGRY